MTTMYVVKAVKSCDHTEEVVAITVSADAVKGIGDLFRRGLAASGRAHEYVQMGGEVLIYTSKCHVEM